MSAVDFESIAREGVEAKERLCKTCRHYRRAWLSGIPKCTLVRSVVDGKPCASCQWERTVGGCGGGGRNWEPKR